MYATIGCKPAYSYTYYQIKGKNIPDLREFCDGRNIMLAFDDDIGNFLSCHLQSNSDDDAITLANASKIIKREILKMENIMFDGNFKTKCEEDSVPKSLVTLIGVLLGGPNILSQSNNIVETLGYNTSQYCHLWESRLIS